MSDLNQVPFGNVDDFAANPEPRCPCLLLLDTSGSMTGDKIAQLNQGLLTFSEELKGDGMAAKRVEVAIVTFGPVNELQPFTTADVFAPPTLTAQGDTPMGAAVMRGIQMVTARKSEYRQHGIGYYRPWIFLITDGDPTDDVSAAISAVREGEAQKSFSLYAIAVDQANVERLKTLTVPSRPPLKLRGMSFRELFVWLSNSLGTRARSQPGEQVQLPNHQGWAVAE